MSFRGMTSLKGVRVGRLDDIKAPFYPANVHILGGRRPGAE